MFSKNTGQAFAFQRLVEMREMFQRDPFTPDRAHEKGKHFTPDPDRY